MGKQTHIEMKRADSIISPENNKIGQDQTIHV